jgi:DnaJ-class molecular chaperone
VFSLDQLTVNFEDIKEAFRRLAKEHHLDKGGDSRGMERLQKNRDSLLAFL